MGNILCILIFTFLLFPQSSWARWAELERDGAPYMQRFEKTFTVKADGSYQHDTQLTLTVLNNIGRKALKTMPFIYQKDTTKFEILSAKTLNGLQEFLVPLENISDKPLADDTSGFGTNHRVVVAFPNVNIGSQLHLDVTQHRFRPDFSKHFFFESSLDNSASCLKGSKFIFRSELPLKIKLRNGDIFQVTDSLKNGIQTIEVELKKDFYFNVVEEPYGNDQSQLIPSFVVSSAASYNDFLDPVAESYEEKLSQNLPDRFQPILLMAQQVTGFENQANLVMAEITEHVHYMGDWRSIQGRFIAQDMKKVAEKGFGDCKDFATLTTKILRQLGYHAHIALVKQGLGIHKLPELPSNFFDHAIVHVQHEGVSYWLDPTHPISYTGNRPNISGRYAVVLMTQGTKLEKIPLNQAKENQAFYLAELVFKENGLANLKQQVRYQGIYAVDIQASGFGKPTQQIEHDFVSSFTQGDKVQTIHRVVSPVLPSRLPSDLTGEFEIDYFPSMVKTPMGLGFTVKGFFENFLTKIDSANYVRGVFLGVPQIVQKSLVIKEQQLTGESHSCTVDSPWFNLKTSIRQDGNNIRIETMTYLLDGIITNEQLKSKSFSELQESLKACAEDFVIIMKKSQKPVSVFKEEF